MVIIFIVGGYTLVLSIGHLALYVLFVIVVVIQSAMQARAVKMAVLGEATEAKSRTVSVAEETMRGADFVKMVEHRKEGLKSSGYANKLPPAEILDEEDSSFNRSPGASPHVSKRHKIQESTENQSYDMGP